jgi:hypothetical protein
VAGITVKDQRSGGQIQVTAPQPGIGMIGTGVEERWSKGRLFEVAIEAPGLAPLHVENVRVVAAGAKESVAPNLAF